MLLAALVSIWGALASAHEIRPAIMDVTVAEGRMTAAVDLNAEAILSGIDLSRYADTNEAPEAEAYDRLRALPPEALAEAVREGFARFAEGLRLEGAGPVALEGVEVVPEPEAELPRDTRVTLSAEAGAGGVRVGWAPAYGELIVRETGGAEGAFAGLLPTGALSPALGAAPPPLHEVLAQAVVSGFEHIVPKGLDHIVFVLGLFFYALRLRPLLWQVSAFTLAHTVTLALAATGRIPAPPAVVEPLIALSIAWVGVENVLFHREGRPITWTRIAVVFGFGLLHGMGFALVFADALVGQNFLLNLVGFNIGVELGQLSVLLAAFLLLGLPFGRRAFWRRYVAVPASCLVALTGLWWFLERTVLA